MEETYKYICNYCKVEYVPARRRVQKFCSKSCYNGYTTYKRKQQENLPKKRLEFPPVETKPEKTKIDKISPAGIVNSVIGNLASDGIKALLTKKQDKPLTLGDFLKIVSSIEQLQEIKDMPPKANGARPHFDLKTKTIVYVGGNDEQAIRDNLIA